MHTWRWLLSGSIKPGNNAHWHLVPSLQAVGFIGWHLLLILSFYFLSMDGNPTAEWNTGRKCHRFPLLRVFNMLLKFGCTDFVDRPESLLHWRCTHRRRWVEIKRLGYAPPRNWDASGAGEPSARTALILWLCSVNKGSTFDGTCQVSPECRGWSSLVRQLSAPQSPESLRLLLVFKQRSRLRWAALFSTIELFELGLFGILRFVGWGKVRLSFQMFCCVLCDGFRIMVAVYDPEMCFYSEFLVCETQMRWRLPAAFIFA